MTANKNPPRRCSLWCCFGLRSYLIAVPILVCLLFVVAAVVQSWYSFRVATISARLTLSGCVMWGDDVVPITSMRPKLEHSANELRSHGFTRRLLIECYRDTRDSDIVALTGIGREVGFDIVEIDRHSWPSPLAEEEPD